MTKAYAASTDITIPGIRHLLDELERQGAREDEWLQVTLVTAPRAGVALVLAVVDRDAKD